MPTRKTAKARETLSSKQKELAIAFIVLSGLAWLVTIAPFQGWWQTGVVLVPLVGSAVTYYLKFLVGGKHQKLVYDVSFVTLALPVLFWFFWDYDGNGLSNVRESLAGLHPTRAMVSDQRTGKAISDCSYLDWRKSKDYDGQEAPSNSDGDAYFDISENSGGQATDFTSVPSTKCKQVLSDKDQISPFSETVTATLNGQALNVHPKTDEEKEGKVLLSWEHFQIPMGRVMQYELIFIIRRVNDYDDPVRQTCKVLNRTQRKNFCEVTSETLRKIYDEAKKRKVNQLQVFWNIKAIDDKNANHLLFARGSENHLPNITFSFVDEK